MAGCATLHPPYDYAPRNDSNFGCHCDRSEAISMGHALAPHGRAAVEAGLDRVERDVGPALRVHEFFPAPIEEALVVFRDVPLGDEARIIRMRPRVPQTHRQLLGVLAA